MLRFSRNTSALFALSASCFALGIGCHSLFDIEEKELRPAGAGGSGSSSSGETSSSSGSSSSGMGSSSGGLLMCKSNGPPPNPDCMVFNCNTMPDVTVAECACGTCPHECGGAGCNNSMCNVQRMAKVNRFAYTIATNGEAIFWAAFDEAMNNSYIYRLEFSDVDDDSPVIVGETEGIVRLIVADCDYVYMAVTGDGIETIRKVHAVGNPEVAVDIASNLAAVNVNAMAVDQDYVYFSAMDNGNNEIRAWRKGGEVRTVAKTVDRVTGMVRHGNFLYWADVGANQLPGQIKRAMIPDGSGIWTPETIRKNAGRPFGLAVDEMFVYWVDLNSMDGMRKLRKSPAVKAPPVELPDIPVAMINVNNASSFPANWLSVDGEYVYFIDNLANGAGTISRTRKQIMLAPTESLASMANSMVPFSAYSLITDAKRVYFAAPADPAAGSSVLWVAK